MVSEAFAAPLVNFLLDIQEIFDQLPDDIKLELGLFKDFLAAQVRNVQNGVRAAFQGSITDWKSTIVVLEDRLHKVIKQFKMILTPTEEGGGLKSKFKQGGIESYFKNFSSALRRFRYGELAEKVEAILETYKSEIGKGKLDFQGKGAKMLEQPGKKGGLMHAKTMKRAVDFLSGFLSKSDLLKQQTSHEYTGKVSMKAVSAQAQTMSLMAVAKELGVSEARVKAIDMRAIDANVKMGLMGAWRYNRELRKAQEKDYAKNNVEAKRARLETIKKQLQEPSAMQDINRYLDLFTEQTKLQKEVGQPWLWTHDAEKSFQTVLEGSPKLRALYQLRLKLALFNELFQGQPMTERQAKNMRVLGKLSVDVEARNYAWTLRGRTWYGKNKAKELTAKSFFDWYTETKNLKDDDFDAETFTVLKAFLFTEAKDKRTEVSFDTFGAATPDAMTPGSITPGTVTAGVVTSQDVIETPDILGADEGAIPLDDDEETMDQTPEGTLGTGATPFGGVMPDVNISDGFHAWKDVAIYQAVVDDIARDGMIRTQLADTLSVEPESLAIDREAVTLQSVTGAGDVRAVTLSIGYIDTQDGSYKEKTVSLAFDDGVFVSLASVFGTSREGESRLIELYEAKIADIAVDMAEDVASALRAGMGGQAAFRLLMSHYQNIMQWAKDIPMGDDQRMALSTLVQTQFQDVLANSDAIQSYLTSQGVNTANIDRNFIARYMVIEGLVDNMMPMLEMKPNWQTRWWWVSRKLGDKRRLDRADLVSTVYSYFYGELADTLPVSQEEGSGTLTRESLDALMFSGVDTPLSKKMLAQLNGSVLSHYREKESHWLRRIAFDNPTVAKAITDNLVPDTSWKTWRTKGFNFFCDITMGWKLFFQILLLGIPLLTALIYKMIRPKRLATRANMTPAAIEKMAGEMKAEDAVQRVLKDDVYYVSRPQRLDEDSEVTVKDDAAEYKFKLPAGVNVWLFQGSDKQMVIDVQKLRQAMDSSLQGAFDDAFVTALQLELVDDKPRWLSDMITVGNYAQFRTAIRHVLEPLRQANPMLNLTSFALMGEDLVRHDLDVYAPQQPAIKVAKQYTMVRELQKLVMKRDDRMRALEGIAQGRQMIPISTDDGSMIGESEEDIDEKEQAEDVEALGAADADEKRKKDLEDDLKALNDQIKAIMSDALFAGLYTDKQEALQFREIQEIEDHVMNEARITGNASQMIALLKTMEKSKDSQKIDAIAQLLDMLHAAVAPSVPQGPDDDGDPQDAPDGGGIPMVSNVVEGDGGTGGATQYGVSPDMLDNDGTPGDMADHVAAKVTATDGQEGDNVTGITMQKDNMDVMPTAMQVNIPSVPVLEEGALEQDVAFQPPPSAFNPDALIKFDAPVFPDTPITLGSLTYIDRHANIQDSGPRVQTRTLKEAKNYVRNDKFSVPVAFNVNEKVAFSMHDLLDDLVDIGQNTNIIWKKKMRHDSELQVSMVNGQPKYTITLDRRLKNSPRALSTIFHEFSHAILKKRVGGIFGQDFHQTEFDPNIRGFVEGHVLLLEFALFAAFVPVSEQDRVQQLYVDFVRNKGLPSQVYDNLQFFHALKEDSMWPQSPELATYIFPKCELWGRYINSLKQYEAPPTGMASSGVGTGTLAKVSVTKPLLDIQKELLGNAQLLVAT